VAPEIADGASVAEVNWVISPGAALAAVAVNTTPDATRARDIKKDEKRRMMASSG